MLISEREKVIQACLSAEEKGQTGGEKINAIINFLKAEPFVPLKDWSKKLEKLSKEKRDRIEYDAGKYEQYVLSKSKEKIKIIKKKPPFK